MTKEDRLCVISPDGSILRADGQPFSDIVAAAAHLRHAERDEDVRYAIISSPTGGWLIKGWNR